MDKRKMTGILLIVLFVLIERFFGLQWLTFSVVAFAAYRANEISYRTWLLEEYILSSQHHEYEPRQRVYELRSAQAKKVG